MVQMNHRYRLLTKILPLVALGLFWTQDRAHACGGFFCSTSPMNQVGERILFVVDEGVVTTHVQIEYTGSASDFAWILPVPSPPDLQVSHNEIFRQLQFATQPFFQLNWDENKDCDFFFWPTAEEATVDFSRADDGVEVVSAERVGPYDTVVISAENAASVTAWLTDNGYNLGDLGAELLAPYVEESFYFLALKLAPDRQVGDLQPIALTYETENAGIPIRLTAVATQPNMGVLAWILGSHRSIPNNYLHVQINEARIDWFNGGFNYSEVVTEAANEAGGQAFATDYAGPSTIMEDRIYQEGRFDLDRLRSLRDPVEYIDTLLRQGFPRDTQMQALLRRHMPMPQIVLEQGVLQVIFGGDEKAYQEAAEDGWLLDTAERSFYNGMGAYEEWLEGVEYDLGPLTDEIQEVVVEPLRATQDLFGDYPYLTRLYTTLSAEEMTVDPMFSFNPDLPDVPNMRTAQARWECPDGNPEEIDPRDVVVVITLADGREIRSRPFGDVNPDNIRTLQPAAALIERIDESGPPVEISRLTSVSEGTQTPPLPAEFALLPNYPNPFNSGTVLPFRVPDSVSLDEVFSLRIYNLVGQSMRTLFEGFVLPGYNTVDWDGLDEHGNPVSSGIYFYLLESGDTRLARKLLLVR
jgi:hypothetical protein